MEIFEDKKLGETKSSFYSVLYLIVIGFVVLVCIPVGVGLLGSLSSKIGFKYGAVFYQMLRIEAPWWTVNSPDVLGLVSAVICGIFGYIFWTKLQFYIECIWFCTEPVDWDELQKEISGTNRVPGCFEFLSKTEFCDSLFAIRYDRYRDRNVKRKEAKSYAKSKYLNWMFWLSLVLYLFSLGFLVYGWVVG